MGSWSFDESLKTDLQQLIQKYESKPQVKIKCQLYHIFSHRIKSNVCSNTEDNIEIIDLTSDSEETISQSNKKKEEINDSVLQDTPNNKINNVLSKQLEDFCGHIADSLEEVDSILDEDDILQLLKEKNIPELGKIFNFLSNKLSSQGVFNLCHSICISDKNNKNIIIENICTYLLLSHFSDSVWSRYYEVALKEIIQCFPEIISSKLFKPLFSKNFNNLHNVLSVLSHVKINEKKYLLSNLLDNYNELESWNLTILNALYVPTCDNKSKRKLINLMNRTEDNFKKDKIFGKLLVTVIGSLSADLIDLKPILEYITDNNCSVFKGPARKSLKLFEDRIAS